MSADEKLSPLPAPAAAHPATAKVAPASPTLTPEPDGRGKFLRVLVRLVLGTVMIAGGVSLGLVIQKRYLRVMGGGSGQVRVAHAPENLVTDYLVEAFSKAKSSIIIYAGRDMASRRVLDVLGQKAKEGVRVSIILSAVYSPHPTDKLPLYLRQAGVTDVYIHSEPAREQFAIVDDELVIHSEIAWSTPKPETAGFTFSVPDSALAAKFTALAKQRVLKCVRVP